MVTTQQTSQRSTPGKHRWLRISLRTLLVLLTILCVWLAVVFNRVHRQARAVQAIEAAGGHISFDYQAHRTDWRPGDPPPGPAWLRRLTGDDLFRSPQYVRLESDKVNDAFLGEHLCGVSQLSILYIESPHVTDAGVEHIARLPRVDVLLLKTPKITDASLAHIGRIQQLTGLSLECPQITDEGVRHLATLHKLEMLALQSPQVTPSGIEHLHALDRVHTVYSLRDPRNEEPLRALDGVMRVEFVDVPLADAMEFLTDSLELSFDIERVPEDDRLKRVNCNVPNVSIHEGLEAILQQLDLGYYPHAGKFVIAPRDEADAMRPGYRAFRETFSGLENLQVDW